MVKVRAYLAPISEGDSGKIKELEERIASLNNQIIVYLSQIEDLQSQIERKNAEIDTLNNDKTSLQNQLTESNARIAELEEQLESSGSSEELEAANARIAELEGQVNTLNNDKTSLQNQLTTANEQITELQSQIDNIPDINRLPLDMEGARIAGTYQGPFKSNTFTSMVRCFFEKIYWLIVLYDPNTTISAEFSQPFAVKGSCDIDFSNSFKGKIYKLSVTNEEYPEHGALCDVDYTFTLNQTPSDVYPTILISEFDKEVS